MAIDIKAVLLETLLDPTSTEAEKKQAQAALDRTNAKLVKPSPTEDTSTSDRYFREADARIKEHLAKEALHPEPIQVLIKCGHRLFAAASAEVRRQNPTTQAGDLDCLVCPLIAGWMTSPDQAPSDEIREVIGYLKTAKRCLLSVGIDWPVAGLDSPFGDSPWGSDEKSWYAEAQETL